MGLNPNICFGSQFEHLLWVSIRIFVLGLNSNICYGSQLGCPSKLVSIRNNRNWNRNLFRHYPKQNVCFGCFASIPKQRVSMFRLNRNKQKTNRNSSIYLSSRPLIHFIPYPLILRTRFRKEISTEVLYYCAHLLPYAYCYPLRNLFCEEMCINLIQHSHATIDTCSAERAALIGR